MHITIAPDSFKGTFTAHEIAAMIRDALHSSFHTTLLPMADGGEGTAEILANHFHAIPHSVKVLGPLQEPLSASFYFDAQHQRAFLDMASASGITHCRTLQPHLATTYGTGELLKHAVALGAKEIVLGIGGSATIDGGAGFLMALGAKLLDAEGNSIPLGHHGLHRLETLDLLPAIQWLADASVTLTIPTDVTNPLLGARGAVSVFGPQKGVPISEFPDFEFGLNHFAEKLESAVGQSLRDCDGTGAAGGLGFALLALGARLVSGSEFVAEVIGLIESIAQSDLVITGEGKADATSLSGKVTGYVISLSLKKKKPVLLIAGTLDQEIERQLPNESRVTIRGLFSTPPMSLTAAKSETPTRLRAAIQTFFSEK